MRSRYEEFGKQLLRAALEPYGTVETDVEVPGFTRPIDLWFTPHGARADAPDHPACLGPIADPALPTRGDPALQTPEHQEFLMDTDDIVEAWRQEAIQEGVRQGREEGVRQGREEGVRQGREEGVRQGREEGRRKLLLHVLRGRFGNQVDGETERRLEQASAAQIEIWADRVVSTATLAELLDD
jgi:hypothetical protein